MERIPRARLVWLAQQAEGWRSAGIIDEAAARRIVALYEPDSAHSRGMLALIVLAALMVGVGVLLLIGYNWERLGPVTKVTMAMTGVAATFAASAAAYARRHPLAGETLALVGTLAFVSSIWLIAQVLHIQGHFPDAFMWSAIGALTVAFLIHSRWIGVAAGIFTLAWVAAAGIAPPHEPPPAFLVVGPLAAAVAYGLRSPVMLRVTAFAAALAVVVIQPDRLREVLFFAAVPLTGCAFYAIGAWHRTDITMRLAWQSVGLVILLVTFVLLLIADFHRAIVGGPWWNPAAAVGLAAAAVTATLALRRARDAASNAIAAAAAILVLWMVLVMSGVPQPQHVWVTVFSVMALVISVSLIHTALRADDAAALGFGTVFALVFLIVRWTSVVENMLWSGFMLLLAGGGLFLIARLWRHRDRQIAATGRLS